MHTTLYRKWRPIDFSSVVGQNHITDVLKYEVQNNKTTHAYLFCGSRGTGKTTCAKILAKAINCLSPENGNPCGKCEACLSVESGNATDIIEMDAASNNGVEYIRDIREEVIYTPAFLKKKVYIIDEVHMLSQSAFNALLKTLEEPPEHIVFILATTELQKLPATITSRCQRFDFRRISTDNIAERLEFIALKENISLTHEAAKLIGRLSQGGMRDAISLLELCSGSGKTVDVTLVNEAAGVTGRETVREIVNAVSAKDYSSIFGIISDFSASSIDISVFWQEIISYYRDMLIVKTANDADKFLDLTKEELDDIKKSASSFTREKLLYHIRLLEDGYVTMQKGNSLKRICAEMTLVRMSDERISDTNDALLSRIAELEERLSSGAFTPKVAIKTVSPEKKAQNKVESKPTEKKAEDISPLPSEGGKDRELDSWSEIVKHIERNDMGLASTLKLASGKLRGDKVIISVGDTFSKLLIERDDALSQIASAINSVEDNLKISATGISVVVKKDDNQSSDFLSDF